MNDLTMKIDEKIESLKRDKKDIISYNFAQLVLIGIFHKQYQDRIDLLSQEVEKESDSISTRAFQTLVRREMSCLEDLQMKNKIDLINFASVSSETNHIYPSDLAKNTIVEAKKFLSELGVI